MKTYHATVHSEKTNEIIFEAQVYAIDAEEAHTKIEMYLHSVGKDDIAKLGAILMEIGNRRMTDIPLIE